MVSYTLFFPFPDATLGNNFFPVEEIRFKYV